MIVPGIYSSFLISVCMFIVSKALLISSVTVIVRAGAAIWLNPFSTVLFNVCSAVTVECCVLFVVFWDGDCISQLPYVWYYVGVKSSRGPMCFRCMVLSLSGPCELLFFLCFIASWA